MNLFRVIVAVVIGLELMFLLAVRMRSEFDYPVSTLLNGAIVAVAISLGVLVIRATPNWLVWIAALISGLPIVVGWLFLSILTGVAGSK